MDSRLGFQVGLVADIGSKYFFFHPGLMFISKGGEYKIKETEVTVNRYYIEVPLLFSFKPVPVFRIDVGHYVSYGLFGQTEAKMGSFSAKTDSFDSDDFDFGASFGIGFDIKQYFIGLNYEFSLEISGLENETWALTVGYNF